MLRDGALRTLPAAAEVVRHWRDALPKLRADAANEVNDSALVAGPSGAAPPARGVAAAL